MRNYDDDYGEIEISFLMGNDVLSKVNFTIIEK
jgi:hypothetical protein